MAGDSAIQQDAQDGTASADKKDEQPRAKSPREIAMEQIAATRRANFEQESGIKLEPRETAPAVDEDEDRDDAQADEARAALEKPGDEATPAAKLSVSAQLGKQLEDGTIELSPDDLRRVRVRAKVDGQEIVVDGPKALGQYQKGAAAELRLERATAAQREAERLLKEAQDARATATTATEKKGADAAVKAAQADVAAKKKQYFDAIYAGDEEKAAQLFDEVVSAQVEAAIAGRVPKTDATQLDPDAIARRAAELAVPAVQQVASRESALSALRADYPEIFEKRGLIFETDARINELVDSGVAVADAIRRAGDEVANEYGLQKVSERGRKGNASTTRTERLAAKKEGLDVEPSATGARAASGTPQPLTASERIEQMRRARAPNG